MEANAVLLDVRTPEEHKSGYLEGAVLLPLAELESQISSKVSGRIRPYTSIAAAADGQELLSKS